MTAARDQRIELLNKRLQEGFLICDGAMGTSLASSGHAAGRSLELLNIEQPDLVIAAHRSYLDAGADIIETNSFQGSAPALMNHNLAHRAAELNRAAARLARAAAGDNHLVAGSIGPTGRLLEPYGDYSHEAARYAYREQAYYLADGGVDFFIIETFSDLKELELAVASVAETELPIAASLAFDPNGRTAFGVTAEQAALALADSPANIIGANCGTISSVDMVHIITQFREATDLPLLAQPNAGRPQQTAGRVVYPETPEVMAESAARFKDLGVSIIGACCGSTDAHIKAIASRLHSNSS